MNTKPIQVKQPRPVICTKFGENLILYKNICFSFIRPLTVGIGIHEVSGRFSVNSKKSIRSNQRVIMIFPLSPRNSKDNRDFDVSIVHHPSPTGKKEDYSPQRVLTRRAPRYPRYRPNRTGQYKCSRHFTIPLYATLEVVPQPLSPILIPKVCMCELREESPLPTLSQLFRNPLDRSIDR